MKQMCYYIRVASDETDKENLDNQTAMQPWRFEKEDSENGLETDNLKQ